MDCNILIDALPLTVMVGGRDVPISADFRTSILFEMLMQDHDMPENEKMYSALHLYYPDSIPEPADDAALAMIWFYSCGKEQKALAERSQDRSGRNKRIYDYDVDAPHIYAAFLSQYKIDLQDIEYLHWWKFMALFLGLNADNEICKIMEYRAVDLSKIKSKSERERYARLQARYRLPDTRTAEQKQRDIGAILGGMIK